MSERLSVPAAQSHLMFPHFADQPRYSDVFSSAASEILIAILATAHTDLFNFKQMAAFTSGRPYELVS